jgi:hypothetical protein
MDDDGRRRQARLFIAAPVPICVLCETGFSSVLSASRSRQHHARTMSLRDEFLDSVGAACVTIEVRVIRPFLSVSPCFVLSCYSFSYTDF